MCVLVYCRNVVCVSCYLYYIIKMDMMGMVFIKIGGCVLHVYYMSAMFAQFSPIPAREQTRTAIYAYTYTRIHTCSHCSPAAGRWGVSFCIARLLIK